MRKNGILALALLTALLLGGCAKESAKEAPELMEPVGVDLDFAEATYRDLYTLKQYAYSVVPYVEELFFTVDGTVETVDAYLGARVQAGDALITLDESDLLDQQDDLNERIAYYEALYASENRSAQIDIEIAEMELSRLRSQGANEETLQRSQADLDMRKLTVKQTRETQANQLDTLKKQLYDIQSKLGKNVLSAPFDGTIVWNRTLFADYGVQAYDVMLKIADDSRMSLSGEYLSENTVQNAREAYALINGKRYEIQFEPIDMDEYFSTVFGGGTVQARFSFVGEPEGVACGDYAALCLVTGYVEDALSIPANALYSDDVGKYVYRLEGDDRVRVAVKTGGGNGLYVQITEGLKEGDRVYVKE